MPKKMTIEKDEVIKDTFRSSYDDPTKKEEGKFVKYLSF